jgi:hypothetical protein
MLDQIQGLEMASPNVQEPGVPLLPHAAETEEQRAAIRLQLGRLLDAASFRNSKRFSELLSYLVGRTLDGRSGELKERSIGVDVFGRAPDYDTNADHVVRTAAGELRKRIAQYYLEPNHESEIRIELVPGSYVPHFRQPNASPPLPTETLSADPSGDLGIKDAPPPPAPQVARSVRWRIPALAAVGLVVLVATGLTISSLAASRSAFEQFWGPVVTSPGTVSVSIGSPHADETPTTVIEFERTKRRHVSLTDATALAAVAGLLQAKGKQYRILSRSSTTFSELQGGPVVLIGVLNNDWTMRLAGTLRFYAECDRGRGRILDKQNPSNTSWELSFLAPYLEVTKDYAIVSRVRDPKTEQVAVIVGGIAGWGTMAAGQFVGDPAQLKKIEPFVKKGWEHKNLQLVISTDVIRGNSGPPRVIAAHSW